jgi:hypothetical protein
MNLSAASSRCTGNMPLQDDSRTGPGSSYSRGSSRERSVDYAGDLQVAMERILQGCGTKSSRRVRTGIPSFPILMDSLPETLHESFLLAP